MQIGLKIYTIPELEIQTLLDCAKEAIKHKEPFSADLFCTMADYKLLLYEEQKTNQVNGSTMDEELIDCVECGHSVADCICNIEDEFDEGGEEFE